MRLSEPPTNIDYLKSKIQRGDDQAMFLLGNNYFYGGNGLKIDYAKAIKWYERAQKSGNADAMNRLGLMYKTGNNGVDRDYYKAANLFLAGAKKGNVHAQYNLAGINMMNEGIGPNYKVAVGWYLKSAKQGHASSQFSLGAAYENGHGVEQDYKEAEKWYLKAAEQGHQYAQSNLNNLRQKYIGKDMRVETSETHSPPESDEATGLEAVEKEIETKAHLPSGQQKVQQIRNNFDEVYETYKDIPLILRSGLRKNTTFSSYIKNIEFSFARVTGGYNLIDEDVLEKLKKEKIGNAIKLQRSRTLNYDDDFDGQVTLEEVTTFSKRQTIEYDDNRRNSQIESSIKKIMLLDKNNDEIITSEEMLILDKRVLKQIQLRFIRSFDAYFELDLNKDSVLTLSEFKTSAKKAFSSIDLDKDSKISAVEFNKSRNGKKQAGNRLIPVPLSTNDTASNKIKKTAALIKSVRAATSTFRDMYDALPGDMKNAEKRIPGCKPNKCASGNSDGIIGDYKFNKVIPYKDERFLFWSHLRKTNLLGGYEADSNELAWGKSLLASPLDGGFHVYTYNGEGNLPQTFEKTKARKGLYLILTNDLHGDFSNKDSHFLTVEQAARLDRKIDDGMPLTGSIIAAGKKECIEEKAGIIVYKEDRIGPCLSLFVRIQATANTREKATTIQLKMPQKTSIARITMYPATISTAIVRMIISGTAVEDIYFDESESIKDVGNPTRYVFHGSGGNARYIKPPEYAVANKKERWIFSSGWKVNKIGTTTESQDSNEIIAFIPSIKYDTCKEINTNLRINLRAELDTDQDGVPKGSNKDILPTTKHNMVKTHPSIKDKIDIIYGAPFDGHPFGCYDLSDGNGIAGDGPYVYYHVLVVR